MPRILEWKWEEITKRSLLLVVHTWMHQPPKRIILKKYSSVSQASLLLVALYYYNTQHSGLKFVKHLWVVRRHAQPKGSDCPVLASYQMWFCQKLLKNAKNNTKIVKIWRFLWKATSGSTKIHNLRFFGVFDQFCCEFWHYQMWLFTKIVKSWLF